MSADRSAAWSDGYRWWLRAVGFFLAACLALAAAATFLIRGVWGADSPAWYFAAAGAVEGTVLACIWIRKGWW